jgi:hypothetical protein
MLFNSFTVKHRTYTCKLQKELRVNVTESGMLIGETGEVWDMLYSLEGLNLCKFSFFSRIFSECDVCARDINRLNAGIINFKGGCKKNALVALATKLVK